MRVFRRVAVGLVLYLAFLVWRFPYEAAVERSIFEIQQATGSTITWESTQAGPLGLHLRNLKIRLVSGARVELTDARAWPTFNGLVAELRQAEGTARVQLSQGTLTVSAQDLTVDTGNPDLGQAEVTVERLQYSLTGREGQGEVRMVLPKISAPLPIPAATRLELGTSVRIQPANPGPGTTVQAEVRVTGGDKVSGAGSVEIRSAPNLPSPTLTGNVEMETPAGKGTLRLGGSWAKPTWTVIPASPR